MTHEELDILLDDMYNSFIKLPNPEREPKQFKYFVNLYKQIKGLHNEKSENTSRS